MNSGCFTPEQHDYALVDCGDGRRLERFGNVTVSRPAPGALWRRKLSDTAWSAAGLFFERGGGWRGEAPPDWRVRLGGVTMRLRPAGAGQVGVFPEHAVVAEKILSRCAGGAGALRVLNLFAHTGLATLMFAAAGCEITHVDGAAVAVKQARENAVLSGLAEKPVRWIVDDAIKFMRREERRGRRYDVVLADPPAFGRGGKNGGEWKLERDLPMLPGLAGSILDAGGMLALTCHSEGWEEGRLSEVVRESGGFEGITEEGLALAAEGARGNPLPGGRLALAVVHSASSRKCPGAPQAEQ